MPGDRDGDGVPDVSDAFPDDPTETSDADGDGIGSFTDGDDDGDMLPDDTDPLPRTPALRVINTVPPVVLLGQEVRFPFRVVGPPGATLLGAIGEAPDGAELVGNEVVWQPTGDQVGEQVFELLGSDGTAVVLRRGRAVVVAPRGDAVTGLLGPEGGVLEVSDPASALVGLRLHVPPGALEAELEITIRAIDAGGAHILPGGDEGHSDAGLFLQPDGLRFAVPADLRLPRSMQPDFPVEEALAFAWSPGRSFVGRPELVTVDAEGRWHVSLTGFSVARIANVILNATPSEVFVGAAREVDRRAQELALGCSQRLGCGICSQEGTACGAFAALGRCVFESYERAVEELGEGAGFTPDQFLASFYDFAMAPEARFDSLSLLGEEGPAGGRPDWLLTHTDGERGSGYRVFDTSDADRTGRRDHFATNALTPRLVQLNVALVGEPSVNDRRINALGQTFGHAVREREVWGGAEIESWLKAGLCVPPDGAPMPTACEGGEGPGGCCPRAPEMGCVDCLNPNGCYWCRTDSTCRASMECSEGTAFNPSFALNDSESLCRSALCGRGKLAHACETDADCSDRLCDLSCRAPTWDAPPVCCVLPPDRCAGDSDCCGFTTCVDGHCQCRAQGERCLRASHCCGGMLCTDGRCA